MFALPQLNDDENPERAGLNLIAFIIFLVVMTIIFGFIYVKLY